MNKKTLWSTILAVVVVLVIAGAAYAALKGSSSQPNTVANQNQQTAVIPNGTTPTPKTTTTPQPPTQPVWETYISTSTSIQISYPTGFQVSEDNGKRNAQIEGQAGLSPVYYNDMCFAAPSFADHDINLVKNDDSGKSKYFITVAVNNLTSYPNVYFLEDGAYGYGYSAAAPDQFHLVNLGTLNQNLQQKVADTSGKQVEYVNEFNTTVEHYVPYTSGSPCQNTYWEEYQGFSNNKLITVLIHQIRDAQFTEKFDSSLFNSILDTIKLPQ